MLRAFFCDDEWLLEHCHWQVACRSLDEESSKLHPSIHHWTCADSVRCRLRCWAHSLTIERSRKVCRHPMWTYSTTPDFHAWHQSSNQHRPGYRDFARNYTQPRNVCLPSHRLTLQRSMFVAQYHSGRKIHWTRSRLHQWQHRRVLLLLKNSIVRCFRILMISCIKERWHVNVYKYFSLYKCSLTINACRAIESQAACTGILFGIDLGACAAVRARTAVAWISLADFAICTGKCYWAVTWVETREIKASSSVQARILTALICVGLALRTGETNRTGAHVLVDHVNALPIVLTWVGSAFIRVFWACTSRVASGAVARKWTNEVRTCRTVLTRVWAAFIDVSLAPISRIPRRTCAGVESDKIIACRGI